MDLRSRSAASLASAPAFNGTVYSAWLVSAWLPMKTAVVPPMLVVNDSTAGSAPRTVSSWRAAASVWVSPVPEGSFWVMVRLSLPIWPMKSVFSWGARASVPANSPRAINRVIQRWARAQLSTGRYAFWTTVSFSGNPCWAAIAASCFTVGFMNQDAKIGTTVSETSSEASSATVTATAKGRKIAPACPPTRPIGRNTATVVRVELVTAPATSRTAFRIDLRPNSP